MNLDMLKLKRLCEGKRTKSVVARTTKVRQAIKRLTTDSKGNQIYTDQKSHKMGALTGKAEDVVFEEGKEHTPKFVQHCVSAIIERPKDLARVKSEAPDGDEGSPFTICQAKYNENKRSLTAKHSRGEHHSTADYEQSLAKLREDTQALRRQTADRTHVFYSDAPLPPAGRATRHLVRYMPRD